MSTRQAQRMKALVIEDSPIYRKLVEHTLTELGFEAIATDDTEHGLDVLQHTLIDLLILDLHLPGHSGLDIARRVRAQSAHRLMPVLLLTSDESEAVLQQALEAGVTEVFRKAKLDQLHTLLKGYIGRLKPDYRGRVMLVEDSATMVALLKYILVKMGLTVDTFTTGEAALAALTAEPPQEYDLIVSDIVLAGQVTGLGVVRAVRAMEGEICRIPVLGLSGMEDAARKVEMLRLGANDYVSKPVIEEEFKARVGNLITGKQLLDQVQQQRRELRERSIRDALTGLFNRHYLVEVSGQMVGNAHRRGEALSMLMVDLDHFKKINDGHGHDVGDKVLAAVGRLLESSCRSGDVAARYGGEEFVVLLANCGATDAPQRAQRLLEELRVLHPAGLSVTASIGVATLDLARGMDFDTFFKAADEAAYAGKQQGRDRVVQAAGGGLSRSPA
ncbi:diguanylate cyclase [Pelomonas sp. KK5]|uniref:diguanylate cyclase n=1 Tax=Pelomonas sp. KK5 TaxID=1855730 RepID=UPI0009FADCE4|nr:diguanylate cyclase [Pelomonas sp. KK5]